MRIERLVESRGAVLDLSLDEAAALLEVGRRLASQDRWLRRREPEESATPASVIECIPFGHRRWSVRVPNAVGVIHIEDLHLVVEPKIPLRHLLYLFERSGAFPRIDTSTANLSTAESLWPLVAAWFLVALERLLRGGLSSGYRETRDELKVARGRIAPAPTSRAFMKGRVLLDCEYEDFDVDTPLNRVLKAAGMAVAGSAALDWDLRRRATRAMNHMEGIGRLGPNDLAAARPERHTSRYAAPLQLAKHILLATGRGIEIGEEHGYAFLIRTPDMVEEGLRRVAGEALGGRVAVAKRTWFLRGSHHSLTPDIVFGNMAVGDVKYKLWAGDWDRSDLYQLVTFATGFGVTEGLRLGFATVGSSPQTVHVGPVRLSVCDWLCDGTVGPPDAERRFASAIQEWWGRVEAASSEDVNYAGAEPTRTS